MSSRNLDAEDTASQRSGTSGASGTTGVGGASETSSQRSDSKFLRRERASAEREEGDLLEQKRSIQDGIFSCMYTLVRQSALSSWKFAVLKVLLEGLMGLIVVFNPSMSAWRIDTSNTVWEIVRWTVWRSPIMRLYGYDTYIVILYIMVVAVFLAVVGLVVLTLAMRRQEQSKWLRLSAIILHIVYDVMFMMLYVSFFDYFVFTANCSFTGSVKEHVYFKGVMCLEMPHILHMSIALMTAAVFFVITALMVVASSDLNPVSLGYLSSPAAMTRLKILTAKAAFVIAANDFQSWPKPQALLIVFTVALICWWNFRRLPFYRTFVNIVWSSLWFGIMYVAVLLAYVVFGKDGSEHQKRDATLLVLYGIFPAIAFGWVVCGLHAWWAARPSIKFKDLALGTRVQKIHKFGNPDEVELLSRVMRKFTIDETVDDAAATLGETIIKAGMQVFPNSPYLLILYANFLLEVRKDGPASRTQLQLASRHSPSLVERYQIFCTGEASKRLKDSQDGGMDLQAYIEFRRNFRAVLRVHKEVLLLQADLWGLMLRSSLRVAEVDKALDLLEASTMKAHQVYKRVLERYPTNGKLLRCYGKFLEDVKHDPLAATRAYNEANRNGGGDAIMNLDLSSLQQGAVGKPELLTSMSMEDDAVVVINAEGVIMMVSQAVQSVFGYPKVELEGANVSLLMPQPFSQRHNGYLQRYAQGGAPQILDSTREVVALHKERYVFPMALCVTKMSGAGTDSIFLGVCRPLPTNSLNMRAWLAPNGVFLCADQQFASLCGIIEVDLIGRTLASMVADDGALVEQLLETCREATPEDFMAKSVRLTLHLNHRYLEPVPVEVVVSLAGTEGQRIFVLGCRRVDGAEGNMLVVDSHMKIRFASCGVSTLLGFSMRKLATMRLDQLLPPPFNTLHSKYLRDPPAAIPPTSCRAGKVVHLLNENGSCVPVRIKLSMAAATELAMTLFVIQIEKQPQDELLTEKQLVITSTFGGRVLSVSQPDSELFGFRAGNMVGCSLCDSIDIFQDWRDRAGESQMQLLMLALLDKEQETPGTSWRVRVHDPPSDSVGRLPSIRGAKKLSSRKVTGAAISKSACLQVELHESIPLDQQEEAEECAGEGGGSAVDAESSIAASSGVSGTRVRVTLWRRDLLTGVVELDEELVVRRASPMTGLIVGMPSTAMLKKPIQRFLDVPPETSWEKLAESHVRHKRGVLKGSGNHGVVSPPMAFIGPHPDTGTMRIIIQGVQVLAPGGRSKVTVTLHPDTTFAGAHADLMRVLHLDIALVKGKSSRVQEGALQPGLDGGGRAGGGRQQSAEAAQMSPLEPQQPVAGREGEAEGAAAVTSPREGAAVDTVEEDPAEGIDVDAAGGVAEEGPVLSDGDISDGSNASKERKAGADATRDLDAEGQAKLHRRAASQSEFVAQWVRTLTKRRSGAQDRPGSSSGEGARAASGPPPPSPPAAGVEHKISTLAVIPEDGTPLTNMLGDGTRGPGLDASRSKRRPGQSFARAKSGGMAEAPWAADGSRQSSRDVASPPTGANGDGDNDGDNSGRGGGGGGGDGRDPGAEGGGDKWEKGSEGDSSADGSQAASGISSATDQHSNMELMIDSRRGRLLRALQKLMLGPILVMPMDRLRLHSYALLAIMLLTHIVAYVVVMQQISEQHHDVRLVHRQALAMDRSQLIAVRAMMGAFCERDNVTAKVSVCANSMSFTVGKLHENVDLMEEHHQFVYLGASSSSVLKLMPEVYKVWTQHDVEYHTYLDTATPRVITEASGAWVLGNRYIAAAREALYWLPQIGDRYRLHRTFQFLIDNGLGPLFTSYAKSLDLLVDSAWKSVDVLQTTLIILLVVEPLFIQLCCLAYEWVLVQRLERARLVGILAMVGLPAPVLRQLATKDAKVIDDSDDDEEGDDDDDDDEPREAAASKIAASSGKISNGGGSAVKGVRHADGGKGKADAKAADVDAASPDKPLKLLSAKQVQDGSEESEELLVGLGKGADAALGGSDDQALVRKRAARNTAQPVAGAALEPESIRGGIGAGGDNGRPRLEKTRGAGLAANAGDGAKLRQARVRGMQINGKQLVPSAANLTKFMAPFVLWNIALVIVYVVSLLELNAMQGPLASLNMASHIIYRYTRVRAIAFGLVSQDDMASRSLWRDLLTTELRYFESEYDALMYGGVPITQLNSVFKHAVPPSTFASTSFANEFFRNKRCFQYEKSHCVEPGDPYYEVTHNGLDVMVRRMISEMRLLTEDADEDVAYNGTRYFYMYRVGGNDLYEGLQQAAQLFVDYSISRYNAVGTLHTILLVITIVLGLLFLVLVLWPHLARLKNDASRQSALLSHVPPEVDVRSHVRAVFKRAIVRRGVKAAKGRNQVLPTSLTSANGMDK